MIFALVGNQNCGKTTLFNQLTGSSQHVGNFPGVTVERKDGTIRGHQDAVVVDLPGIYSLSPYTKEELVTRDFILHHHPDGILNIVDATNLERNLYLTLQLLELEIPMVVCLNMMDEVRHNGGKIRIDMLRETLGVPVIPISASKGEGMDALIVALLQTARSHQKPAPLQLGSGPVSRCLQSVAQFIQVHARRAKIPLQFAAGKLVEGDPLLETALQLSGKEKERINRTVRKMEQELDTDREAAMADMRYRLIEALCKRSVKKPQESAEHRRSVRIDAVLTSKYAAIPLFLGIMFLIFWLTFGLIGAALNRLLSYGIDAAANAVRLLLQQTDVHPILQSLVINGVFAGVGSVLSFLPIIVVLFFFLSLLEDSGYMARVAFVMDQLLRRIGLSGISLVPMLIGFGCSVPAIMATRTLSSERDRRMTILLTPFMSCSAKLPIYALFTTAFFPRYRAWVMIGLYAAGILMGILSALLMKHTLFDGKPVPFVMELPNYRFPSARTTWILVWQKARDFLQRAFTVIFLASLVIWFLQTFDSRLHPVSDSQNSMLAAIGRWISPLFVPLGFGNWRASTALLAGFTAKEAVLSTLAVLTGANGNDLPQAVTSLFSPLAAVSFLVFILLYTPCVAAIHAVRRELHSRLSALCVILYQTGVAWLASFMVYQIGTWLLR